MNKPARSEATILLAASLVAAGLGSLLWLVDERVLGWLHPETAGGWDDVLRALHSWTPVLVLGICGISGLALALCAKDPWTRKLGAVTMVAPLVVSAVVSHLKELVGRSRPPVGTSAQDGVRPIIDLWGNDSFPSGHAASAATLAAVLWFVGPRVFRYRGWISGLGILALISGFHRVGLGVHYPSDVFGGFSVAFLLLAVLILMAKHWMPEVRSIPIYAIFVGLVVVTAFLGRGAPRAYDPMGVELVQFHLEPRLLRQLFEPWVGIPLHLAYVPELRGFILRGLLALGGLMVAMELLRRWCGWRHRWRAALLLALWLCVMALLFWTGRLPPDRFVSDDPGVFVDLHVHGSDPVDGAMDRHRMRARKDSRGVRVMALTNHDAPPQDPKAIPGLEWSGFRHADQPYVHLLMLGGRPSATLELRVPPLVSGETFGRDLALEAVRLGKANGCLVIVAHYWATRRVMKSQGFLSHLPLPEEFVAAGVDGFEVSNRVRVAREVDRGWQDEIRSLCKEHDLLMISVSDDHGIPAGSGCITFVEGFFEFGEDRPADVILDRLARGEGIQAVAFSDRRHPHGDPPWVEFLYFLARYASGVSWGGRLSWVLWGGLFWVLTRPRKARRQVP